MGEQLLYQLSVHHHFDAAHRLPCHEGKCSNLHGHRWEVEVVIAATFSFEELLENGGMVRDFGEVKEIIDRLDHGYLNDRIRVPTAEVVATWILDKLLDELDLMRNVVQVTVWESPDCSVTVGGYHA